MWGRRKPEPEPVSQQAQDADALGRGGGKGRPTPKRREAELQRRKRAAPPRNRREAARRSRQRIREERSSARKAIMTGDERHLPPRDAGPVRRFARDYVDSRRTLSEYLLFVVFALLIVSWLGNPVINAAATLAMLVLFVTVIVEMLLIARGVRREVARRWPGEETQKGLGWYTAMRASQSRRLRLPKPKVARGTKV